MRVAVAAAIAFGLLVQVGVADAQPKRKVRIETAPVGAVVYIESKENGIACEPTPCTIELPLGESSIIVELASYDTKYQNVIVPKRGKIKLESLTLDPSIGTLAVPGPAGASISVDGEDKGKAPAELELAAETHKVIITKDGKTLFDQYLDVESGLTKQVPILDLKKGGPSSDVEQPGEGTEPTGDTTDGGNVTKRAPAGKNRGPIASVSAAMSVGFRSFTYDNNQTKDKLRDESEVGQVLLGPLVELWPGNLFGIRALRGLSVMGRFQFRINEQPVTGGGIQNGLSTFWQSFEVSGRHKWLFAEKYGVEISAGWTREQYRFNGTAQDKLLVPDAQYEAIRIGGRFSMLLDAGGFLVEPGIELESRIVSSGGPLQVRFDDGTSVSGLRAAANLVAHFSGFHVRAEAALLRYSWEFEGATASGGMADGGTDAITLLGIYAGYAY